MATAPELGLSPDAAAGIAPNRSLRLRQTSVSRAAVRRLWRALLLPRRPVGRDPDDDRGTGPAWRQPWRGHGAHGFHRFPGRTGLCARQALPDRTGRLLGRPHQFSHRPGRGDRLYPDVRIGREPAAVQHRVDRQPPDPIDRVGGPDQSVLEMVRLFVLWNDHRHPEHQLPGRRRGGAPVDGNADRAWLRLARPVLFRRRGRRRLPGGQFPVSAGVARRRGLPRGEAQSAQSVRGIGIAPQEREATAAAPGPQPRVFAGLPAVPGLHHHSRNLQHVDADVFARLSRLQRQQCSPFQFDFSCRRRCLRVGHRLAQRPSRRERARADHVRGIDRHGGGAARC